MPILNTQGYKEIIRVKFQNNHSLNRGLKLNALIALTLRKS